MTPLDVGTCLGRQRSKKKKRALTSTDDQPARSTICDFA